MPATSFFDTNILVYASVRDELKSGIAERLLLDGGVVSVQVLNEFASLASRKRGLPWSLIRTFLEGVRANSRVLPLDERIHDGAVRWSERYKLAFYDALIVAAALEAGCDTLYSEDMHAGLLIENRLTIVNPFA